MSNLVMFNVLIVDDDLEIRKMLCEFLEQKGFKVIGLENGEKLINHLSIDENYDLIILDINMPYIDGLEACKIIRKQGNDIPIIMLTCMSEDIDKIIGLELGADDYLAKPFNIRELLARIKSVLKRSKTPITSQSISKLYRFDSFTLNTTKMMLFDNDNNEIKLTSSIYTLLLIFLQNSNRVLTRESILDKISEENFDVLDRSIDVRISRLRQKLKQYCKNKTSLIETVRGGGYILNSDVKVYDKKI